MKKFYFFIVAILVTSTMFAQTFQANPKSNSLKPVMNSQVQNNAKAYVTTLQLCADITDVPNGIGVNAADILQGAAQFEAADLSPYAGNYITEIHVGIADASVITSGKIMIWTGIPTAPVVAYEQAVTFTDGWNQVELTTPYQITANEIFIGYEVTVTGGFPMGFDEGPAIAKANWINSLAVGGGWGHLDALNPDLTFNNLIKAIVDSEAGTVAISAAPLEMTFIGYVGEGNPEVKQATIQAVGLTQDITATLTNSPSSFEISSDNVTFGATATIPMTGGTLYVKYNVGTSEAMNDDVITLTSTGATNVSINLTGYTIDCTGTISAPYIEDFTSENSACWKVFDANNDGKTWDAYYIDEALTNIAYVYQYSTTNNAEDWLVSPKILIPSNPTASFDYWVPANSGNPLTEKFEAYVITGAPSNYATGTIILPTQSVNNSTPATQTLDLSAYVGQEVYIGIKVVSDADQFALFIDNFKVEQGTAVNSNIASNISVYPNPANDFVTVANAENANIVIVNMLGEVVANVNNASSNQNIDISKLANGTYFVKVDGEVFKINVVK